MAKVLQVSPTAGFLANLFGLPTKVDKRGAVQIANPKKQGPKGGSFSFANPIFGPGASDSISDFLNLSGGSNVFTTALGDIGRTGSLSALPRFLSDPFNQADRTLSGFVDNATPVVNALIESGLPVDIAGLTRAAQSRFANEILPTVSEQFNPAQGTAFQNVAAREGRLLADELAQLDFSAQEAARQRQLAGITQAAPAVSALSTARVGLPAATIAELNAFSDATDPGARLLEFLLPLIVGPSQAQGTVFQPNAISAGVPDSSGGTGDILGGIGGLVGGLTGLLSAVCWVAEELWGVLDERTWLARAWCYANTDHPFVQRYLLEGQQWATAVHHSPTLRAAVEPTWLWMARQGAQLIAHAA